MVNEDIYFPTFLDFRGRIYPTPNYLSYQSNDLARSLLIFKEALPSKKNENININIDEEHNRKNTCLLI